MSTLLETPTLPVLRVLNDIAHIVSDEHGIEGRVSIVVGPSGVTRSGQKHGHFHARSWEDADGNDIHEIELSGESLKRGAAATVGTLIHELAHTFCHEHDIKDTSDGGRWHNKKFKQVAEDMGLHIERADRIGFSVTTLPESTQEKYAEQITALEQSITAWRREPGIMAEVGEPEKPKAKVYKMQCPECQDPVTVGKGWFERNEFNLRCSLHMAGYEMFTEGGDDDE